MLGLGTIDGMTLTVDEASRTPVVTDAEVEGRVRTLIGNACRRQLWLLFLDHRCVQLPTLVPIEAYPAGPDAEFVEALADSLKHAMRQLEAAQVVLVWERCLGAAAVAADRRWAKALAEACHAAGVPVRAQLISHRRGVRWFAADDYE